MPCEQEAGGTNPCRGSFLSFFWRGRTNPGGGNFLSFFLGTAVILGAMSMILVAVHFVFDANHLTQELAAHKASTHPNLQCPRVTVYTTFGIWVIVLPSAYNTPVLKVSWSYSQLEG